MSVTIVEPAGTAAGARRRMPRALRRLSPGLVLSGGLVTAIIMIAILAPVLAPDSPTAGSVSQRLYDVDTIGHMLGTDEQGRDILSRLVWGARPTLISSIVPVAIAGLIGTGLGVLAGLSRNGVRSLVMRTLDVLYAFPAILLAIAIGASLGPGVKNAIVSLSIVLIAPIARVAESEVLRLRSQDFMEAARASGARVTTIAWRHVLPNIAPPLIVYCTSLIGLAIVYSAGLSFLGLGVVPPHPDWGGMLDDLRADVFERPFLAMIPALAILIASVAFNVLGNSLRRVLDVSEREVTA
jgi:peptide/nickel transport system permease protein